MEYNVTMETDRSGPEVTESDSALKLQIDDATATGMEQTSHSQQEIRHESDAMIPESSVLLNSAAEAGNWRLVKDLISNGDVTFLNIQQASILQKLASATKVSHRLVKDILLKLFSNEEQSAGLKKVAQDPVLEAAKNDNWSMLMTFLMTVDCVLEDEASLFSLLQLMASSHTLTERPYLHTDVLSAVWTHSHQTILNSKDRRVHNIFVQLAAKLNMWSRVCDVLVTKPDLNLLDRDGLSVLHRLVMCPDSRLDSLLPVLLEHGADVIIKNSKRETALHLAAKHQRVKWMHNTDFKDFRSKFIFEYLRKRVFCKLRTFERLIRAFSTLDDCDGEGNTAVIVAAKNDNWWFLKSLLRHGARADITDGCWRSVLHVLALTQFSNVKDLIDESLAIGCVNGGAQVNATDVYGCSALHLAVQSNNWTFLKLLVYLGAHLEVLDGEGYNVLHRLAMTKPEHALHVCSLFLFLYHRGLNLNAECSTGDTILHLAVRCENWTLVKHLIDLGTDVNRRNREGCTVLHLLALYKPGFRIWDQCSFYQHRASNSAEISSVIDGFSDKGVDLERRFSSGDTALQLAARHENWTVFQHLLRRGARIYETDSEGISVMQRFVEATMESTESHSIFQLLLHHSAVTVGLTQHRDSVLQMAAKHEKWTVVEHILRHTRGNEDERDSEGFTVFQRVVTSRGKTFKEGRSCSFVRFLLETCTNLNGRQIVELIHQAAAARNVDAVHVLVDKVEDVNETDSMGFTVLHKVAQCRVSISVAVIRRLVEKGAEINRRCPDGNTALHLAARSNNWMAVKCLLQYGAWANALDNEGNSVLHRLASQSHFRCKQCQPQTANKTMARLVAAVVAKGGMSHQRDSHGNTPLHLAVKNEHWSLAMALIARRASLMERDSRGWTVLHVLSSRCSSLPETSALDRTCLQANPTSTGTVGVTNVNRQESLENGCLSCSLKSDRENIAGMYSGPQNPFLSWSSDYLENPFFFSILAEQHFDHLLICDYFMDNLIPLNAVDHHGNTALLLSAKHHNWDITERLLLRGADVHFVDQQGSSVLHILAAVKPGCHFLSEERHKKILDLLISRSVEVNSRDEEGNTPLQLAAKHGNMEMVMRLLDFHVNVNETDSDGFTLLSRVALSSSPKCENIVTCLLGKGADVNLAGPDGKTPLLVSVLSRNWRVTSSLWYSTSNANIDEFFQEQRLILHRLVEDHSSEMNLSELIARILSRSRDLITNRNSAGMSALQLAIVQKKWHMAGKLLQHGACTDLEALREIQHFMSWPNVRWSRTATRCFRV